MAAGKGRKSSVIREFYSVAEDSKFVICNTCKAKVSRVLSQSRLTQLHHLTSKHFEVQAKYLERKANNEPKPLKETRKISIRRQLSLAEVEDLTKHWDINDHKAQRVHRKIGEMLAIDCQPILMAEDVRFR